jgi:hypothetical protein
MTAEAPASTPPRDVPGAPGSLPPLTSAPLTPPSVRDSFLFGLRIGGVRLRRRRVALLGFLGLALALASAVIERRVSSVGSVDRALVSTFRLVIPLVAFAIVAEVSGRARLSEAAWPAARFGAARRDVVLGLVAAAAAASAALAAVFAVAVVLFASSPASPPIVRDALLSAWIAAVTAFAYVGWFAAGSTFHRHGRGRFWPLLADFVLGGSVGFAGALLPRGNAVNLLGGSAPLGLSQPSSMVILLAGGAALCAFSAWRSDP